MNDDSPAITQQYSFAVGEDGQTDGGIEPAEESVETSLEAFGADVDHREHDTRIDQPKASSFGVDDRKTVTRGDGGDQHAPFADTKDDQQTLTGERAANQCLFETDDTPDTDDRDEEPGDTAGATDEPDDTPRAVATDGGHPEEDDGEIMTDGGHVENHDDDEPDTDDRAEQADEDDHPDASGTGMVAVPRKDLAGVADALDAERETIERNAGTGPKTEELTQHVEECRSTLSALDDTDEQAKINRVTAASAADELHAATNTETGDYAEELRRLASVLLRALDEHPSGDEAEAEQADPESADAQRDDHGFPVGTHVTDRDTDDPNPAVVVALPDEPAYARDIDALDGKSVADVNPNYGASGPVTTVAYADDLDAALDVWREADPDALARICANEEVRTYDFPTARLRKASATDGGRENNPNETTTFDPHQHVPDEIDIITADGIEQVHDHLSDDNAAKYAEASVKEQAAFLWKMVDRGVIDLSIGAR